MIDVEDRTPEGRVAHDREMDRLFGEYTEGLARVIAETLGPVLGPDGSPDGGREVTALLVAMQSMTNALARRCDERLKLLLLFKSLEMTPRASKALNAALEVKRA
jgi:hypothetical protein